MKLFGLTSTETETALIVGGVVVGLLLLDKLANDTSTDIQNVGSSGGGLLVGAAIIAAIIIFAPIGA